MQKIHTLPEAEYGRDALAKVNIIRLFSTWKYNRIFQYLQPSVRFTSSKWYKQRNDAMLLSQSIRKLLSACTLDRSSVRFSILLLFISSRCS
jgi:hypothetical protein